MMDRIANNSMGIIICGSKIMPKFGVSPLAKTLLKPLPTATYTTVPGIMPINVAIAKVLSLTLSRAGTILTSQKGKIGSSLKNNKYPKASC